MATKKTKTIKNPVGNPTKYRVEYNTIVKQLASKGFLDKEICEVLLITNATFILWKKTYPDLLKALEEGKADPIQEVVRALKKRALGCTVEERIYEPKMIKRNGKLIPSKHRVTLIRKTKKELPPDQGACALYLKNRDPDNWRDKQEIEHSGSLGYKVIPDEIDDTKE
jgi:hypothetical protein